MKRIPIYEVTFDIEEPTSNSDLLLVMLHAAHIIPTVTHMEHLPHSEGI